LYVGLRLDEVDFRRELSGFGEKRKPTGSEPNRTFQLCIGIATDPDRWMGFLHRLRGKSPGVVGFRSPVADGAGCPAGVSLTVPGWAIA
jgi:hypothetical protein